MSGKLTLKTLSEQLDRARAQHERRPHDDAAYRRFLEAEIAFLKAQLTEWQKLAAAERRRSLALAKRLKDRIGAYERALRAGKAKPRRRRAAEPLPQLFSEGAPA